jgi:MFS family permease
VVVGAFDGSLPITRARLHIGDEHIAILLVCTGLAAILGMQIMGRLADRVGARRLALIGFAPLTLGALGYSMVGDYWALLVVGAVYGFGNGSLDITMNAIAVQVEKSRDRLWMSFFHGNWSIGNFIGSSLIVLIAYTFRLDDPATLVTTLWVITGLGLAAFAVAFFITPETEVVEHKQEKDKKAKLPSFVYVLALMAIAFGLGEGTGFDWSALHVTTITGVPEATGALAVTSMSLCMVLIRLTGDWIVTRIGRRAVVFYGGIIAVAGYAIASTGTEFWLLLVGWALVGLGMGVVAPQIYGIAGHMAGGRGLATVVTFGYATFLAAPALIGFLVKLLGIQHAMIIPGTLLVGLVILSRFIPKDE